MSKNSKFLKSVTTVFTGNAASQAIAILGTPFLTRIYSPDDFGIFALYLSISSMLVILLTLKYEAAIPVPSDDNESNSIAILSFFVLASSSALSLIILLCLPSKAYSALGLSTLEDHIVLLCVGTFLLGAYRILRAVTVRYGEFKNLSAAVVSQSTIALLCQLVGFYIIGAPALIIGNAIGRLFSVIILYSKKTADTIYDIRYTYSDFGNLAKRHIKYPFYSMPAAFVSAAGSQLPPVIFTAFFSPSAAGLYLIIQRVLAGPMKVIGDSIGQVFVSEARKRRDEGNLGVLAENVYKHLAYSSLIPILIFIAYAPDIFQTVFGEQWSQAGVLAKWLAPAMYLNFCIAPISRVLVILNKQEKELRLQLLISVLRIGALVMIAPFYSLETAVAAYGIGYALGSFVYTLSVFSAMETSKTTPIKTLLVFALCTTITLFFF